MDVGFIGLGRMGLPMAGHIQKQGVSGRLTLLDRRLTEHRLGEASLPEQIADDAALRRALENRFGIVLDDDQWQAALARIAAAPAP